MVHGSAGCRKILRITVGQAAYFSSELLCGPWRTLCGVISVDDRRIFTCGMSNGAFMSARLGSERANRFVAIGCVAGDFASALVPTFAPAAPVSVVLVHGTADSLAVYAGTSSALDPSDGCTVEFSNGTDGLAGSAVVRYRIVGGGHSWPGRAGVLDIGNLCHDIDATQVMADFFTAHPKPGAPSAGG